MDLASLEAKGMYVSWIGRPWPSRGVFVAEVGSRYEIEQIKPLEISYKDECFLVIAVYKL